MNILPFWNNNKIKDKSNSISFFFHTKTLPYDVHLDICLITSTTKYACLVFDTIGYSFPGYLY